MVAGATVGVLFSFFGEQLEISRPEAYTTSFFAFWAVGIGASGLALCLPARPDAAPSLERRARARLY